MTAVLAIDPGFSEVRVGVLKDSDSDVALHTLDPGTDPFGWFRERQGSCPSAVIIAGGPYASCAPGAYALDARLTEDASKFHSWHPRNRMTVRAFEFCARSGVPGVVVDPMSSASMEAESRFSGYPLYERRGVYYAFPQRLAYMEAVRSLGLDPTEAGVITAYLGDEACVAAHLGKRVIETSDPVACEGPFGFTSAGTVPATSFISWLRRRGSAETDTLEVLKSRSGVFAYAGAGGTAECLERLLTGHEGALAGIRGMAYQLSKEIGRAMATLKGRCEAIALTGPGVSIGLLTSSIEKRVSKWCKVVHVPANLCTESLLREGLSALAVKNLLRYPSREEVLTIG